MNAEILLRHLYDLGCTVGLTPDARSLDLDAPKGVLTDELLEVLREHKSELVQMVFEEQEREAIQWEGSPSLPVGVKFTGDARLIEKWQHYPSVVRFVEWGRRNLSEPEFEFIREAA